MAENDLGPTSLGMKPNVAALLSYLAGILTGIIFYLLEKENKFVRFHAMQSIMTFGFFFVLNIVLGFIPVVGWSLMPLVAVVQLVVWIILMVKAYKGEHFKLPIVGDMAQKNA
jgi:uncharacterized membrane protein